MEKKTNVGGRPMERIKTTKIEAAIEPEIKTHLCGNWHLKEKGIHRNQHVDTRIPKNAEKKK